jgi:pyrimidine operon attenuation protein/uracil phosphoribosyltransferase
MSEQNLSEQEVADLLKKLANGMLKNGWLDPPHQPAIIGIQRRGAVLADRLKALLDPKLSDPLEQGVLDITLYRDDLSTLGPHPMVNRTIIPFDVTGKTLLLIDDVIYTGRTIRAALDVLSDLGRPARVILIPLVDRGWREYPIQPDLVGITLDTQADQLVKVNMTEIDGEDSIKVTSRDDASQPGGAS